MSGEGWEEGGGGEGGGGGERVPRLKLRVGSESSGDAGGSGGGVKPIRLFSHSSKTSDDSERYMVNPYQSPWQLIGMLTQ